MDIRIEDENAEILFLSFELHDLVSLPLKGLSESASVVVTVNDNHHIGFGALVTPDLKLVSSLSLMQASELVASLHDDLLHLAKHMSER